MTPEARRDRAAILRRDGVAPASDRVLAALCFLAVSAASACSFYRLSPCQGDAGGEIPWERWLRWTFPGHIDALMWMPLKQRCLSVHSGADKGRLRGHLELHRLRPHCVLVNLPRTPFLVQILYTWIPESLFSLVYEQDIVLR